MGHQLGRMAQTPPNGQDVPNREVVVDFTPSHYRSFLEDFIECDTNKDGFLQSSEIKMMLTKQLKRAPSAVETAAVMRKLDVSLFWPGLLCRLPHGLMWRWLLSRAGRRYTGR